MWFNLTRSINPIDLKFATVIVISFQKVIDPKLAELLSFFFKKKATFKKS